MDTQKTIEDLEEEVERLHGNLNECTERGTKAEAELAKWTRKHDDADLQELKKQQEGDKVHSFAADQAYINGLECHLRHAKIRGAEAERKLDAWEEMFLDFQCGTHGGNAPFCVLAKMVKLEKYLKIARDALKETISRIGHRRTRKAPQCDKSEYNFLTKLQNLLSEALAESEEEKPLPDKKKENIKAESKMVDHYDQSKIKKTALVENVELRCKLKIAKDALKNVITATDWDVIGTARKALAELEGEDCKADTMLYSLAEIEGEKEQDIPLRHLPESDVPEPDWNPDWNRLEQLLDDDNFAGDWDIIEGVLWLKKRADDERSRMILLGERIEKAEDVAEDVQAKIIKSEHGFC